ncbi:MAG: hypothetical protein Q8P32_00635 [Candidatus Komeilibacteria bacterium]|nr:hypothetical protein [Candidatus Komeilibacteria bacterium]
MHSKFWLFFRHVNSKYYFDYLAVFFIALILFGWLQAGPTLAEPDSFYHAKMAVIMSEGKVLQQFPWLQETNLPEQYVNHHFLYHALLVPFVNMFDPLVGVKVATVLFASLLVLSIYWLFKKFEVKYPLVFVLILLTISPWLFRASLVKAPAISFIFLLCAFYCLAHQHWLRLFLLSFAAVWLYGSWPVILVMTITYLIVYWLLEKYRQEESIWHKLKNIFQLNKKVPWRGLLYVVGGLTAGLVINPYFPQNLKFYYQQIIDIALFNYQHVISVGSEWYPYDIYKLIADAPLIMSLLVVSVLLFILTVKKQSIYSWTWGLLAVAFFILTLKSRRQVEFFTPLTVIFAGFTFNDYFRKLSRLHLQLLLNVAWQAIFGLALILVGLIFIFKIPGDLNRAKSYLDNGKPLTYYQQASAWLTANSPKQAVVFNANWSDFPALFYHNSHNYYLTGLDPTFMYQLNPVKYQQYVDITLGKVQQNLKKIIQDDFKADYVLFDHEHWLLEKQLKYSGDFIKVYEDSEAKIYQVRSAPVLLPSSSGD